MSEEQGMGREERILRVTKHVLTRIIRETATAPGMKHPLSEQTIDDMRQCLFLISEREKELVEGRGGSMDLRPQLPGDRTRPEDEVVVSLDSIRRRTE